MSNKPKQKRPFRQRPGPPSGPGKKPLPKYNRGPLSWLVLGLVALSVLMIIGRMQGVEKIDYSPDFEDYREKGYIESIELRQNKIIGKFKQGVVIDDRSERVIKSFEVNYDPKLLPDDFFDKLRDKFS